MTDPDRTPNRWITSPATRLYLYGIGAALLGLLGGYGLIDAAQSDLWRGVLEALLGIGGGAALTLAAANVPRE